MKNPTDRQKEVLVAIYEHIAHHGFAPTLRELGAQLGIKSTNGVNDHLAALQRKGLIERSPMFSRSLRITPKGADEIGIVYEYGPGALVLKGSGALIEEAGNEERTLQIGITVQAYEMLGSLVDTGLFGATRAEVAERLLYEKLRDILATTRRNTA